MSKPRIRIAPNGIAARAKRGSRRVCPLFRTRTGNRVFDFLTAGGYYSEPMARAIFSGIPKTITG